MNSSLVRNSGSSSCSSDVSVTKEVMLSSTAVRTLTAIPLSRNASRTGATNRKGDRQRDEKARRRQHGFDEAVFHRKADRHADDDDNQFIQYSAHIALRLLFGGVSDAVDV